VLNAEIEKDTLLNELVPLCQEYRDLLQKLIDSGASLDIKEWAARKQQIESQLISRATCLAICQEVIQKQAK
jgi:hypothetical protein